MYFVKWNVGQGWEQLYSDPDLRRVKKWAIEHISYTGTQQMRVELHDEEGCVELIFDRNWPE